MTSWSKKQYSKVKPRIKLRVPSVVKQEELKKAEEHEFKQEVEELDVDNTRIKGEIS